MISYSHRKQHGRRGIYTTMGKLIAILCWIGVLSLFVFGMITYQRSLSMQLETVDDQAVTQDEIKELKERLTTTKEKLEEVKQLRKETSEDITESYE